jgi:hypothetical protein
MAGNIAGMFGMINNAVQANPLGSEMGQGLLNTASQGAGNMMGAALGQPGTDFMSPQAKEMQIEQDAQETSQQAFTSNDPQTMEMAAQKLDALGKHEEAARLRQRAGAINAKNNSILEAGNAAIQEEAARKEQENVTRQAVQMAKKDGDPRTIAGLLNGTISAEAYFNTKQEQEQLYELSQGEMLTDKDGNVIRLNPDLTPAKNNGGYEPSVSDTKLWQKLTSSGNELSNWGAKAEALAQQIAETNDWDSGISASVDEYLLEKMGKRDDPQYLRTQAQGVVNHEAIGMLPPGPASDRDIEIVMRGVPNASTAGRDELVEYLQATARVANRQAEYDKMQADYIIRGNHKDFQAAWDSKMRKAAVQEWKAETPTQAIEELLSDPSQAARDEFLETFHWLPEIPNEQ